MKSPARVSARAGLVLLLASPCGLVACGGDTSEPRPTAQATASQVADFTSCDADAELELQSLENFEQGVALDWWGNNDASEGSEVIPPKNQKSPLSAEIDGGRCESSSKAYHLTAHNLSDWGAVFGVNFNPRAKDVSGWDGIAFWAKRGVTSKTSIFFSLTEPHTDPSGGTCVSETEDLTEKCDQFGAGIGLTEEWRFYKVPFGALKQRGYGVPATEPDLSTLIGFSYALDIGEWDVWVDDVSLYRAAR